MKACLNIHCHQIDIYELERGIFKKNAHLKVISKKKSILKKYTQLSVQEMNLLMNLTQIFQ